MAHREDAVIVNALVRQALVSAEEVMGRHGLHSVLRTCGLEQFIDHLPPDDLEPGIPAAAYADFVAAIEDFYGRGARGILRRIGAASFRYALNNQPALMGLAGVALKMLPEPQRIRLVLNNMASALKKSNPQVEAWVDDSGEHPAFVEATCAICHGRQSEKPVCHIYIGSIGAALQWATGRAWRVEETHCMARGDDFCRFEVIEPLN